MKPTYLLIAAVLIAASVWREWAERKSRLWYKDRMLLRASGYFFGIAYVLLVLVIAL